MKPTIVNILHSKDAINVILKCTKVMEEGMVHINLE